MDGVTDDREPRGSSCGPALALRLDHRLPFDAASLLGFLGARAVDGVEEVRDGRFRRTLRLPHGWGVAELTPRVDHVACALRLSDRRDAGAAVAHCRRLLDLDADPVAIAAHLGRDPAIGPLVARSPGLRLPGHGDGAELAVRAVFGQQISVAAARTHLARLVRRCGEPLPAAGGSLTHLFPTPAAISAGDPEALGLPAARRETLLRLVRALAVGDVVVDPGAGAGTLRRGLLAIRGIGPWTADYIAMRVAGDPDVFLASDLGARRALARLGLPAGEREAARLAERWRPWRSYALMHLWASLAAPPPGDNRCEPSA
jgi:AraC family transcriptional regulator of adaptative response / DNA-3-methyladenine glycosylase II